MKKKPQIRLRCFNCVVGGEREGVRTLVCLGSKFEGGLAPGFYERVIALLTSSMALEL